MCVYKTCVYTFGANHTYEEDVKSFLSILYVYALVEILPSHGAKKNILPQSTMNKTYKKKMSFIFICVQ